MPFPINVKPAAAAVKELLAETKVLADTAVVEAPAPAEAAPVDPNKSTYTVTLKTPDGDLAFECPPDQYMLDQTEELDNADDFADLPFACRAVGGDPTVIAAPAMTTLVDVGGLLVYFMIARLVFASFGLGKRWVVIARLGGG